MIGKYSISRVIYIFSDVQRKWRYEGVSMTLIFWIHLVVLWLRMLLGSFLRQKQLGSLQTTGRLDSINPNC